MKKALCILTVISILLPLLIWLPAGAVYIGTDLNVPYSVVFPSDVGFCEDVIICPPMTDIYTVSFENTSGSMEWITAYITDEDGNILVSVCNYSQIVSLSLNMTAGETYTVCAYSDSGTEDLNYTVTVSLCSVVDVIFEDVSVFENVNCSLCEEYDPDTGRILSYNRYSYYPTYTVFFRDGTSHTYEYCEGFDYNGMWVSPEFTDSQSYSNKWGVGTHTACGSLSGFYGISDEFTVTVEENQIASLDINDVTVVEGTNQYNDYFYDPETDTEYSFLSYSYRADGTVSLKDGRLLSIDEAAFEFGDFPITWDDQSYYNQWGVGKHTAHASLFGLETEFYVNIVETPVESITAENITVIYETGGYRTTWNPETGETVPEYYEYHNIETSVTVYFKDGTFERITPRQEYRYGDIILTAEYFDDQSYKNHWGEGNHTATVSFGGVSVNYTVEIIKPPIKSISAEDITVIEFADGYYMNENDFHYQYYPEATITFEDGTVQTGSPYNFMYKDIYLEPVITDGQYENPWGVGTHTVKLSVCGAECTFNVTVEETPVEYIEILNTTLKEGIDGYYYDVYGDGNEYFVYTLPKPSYTVYFKDGTSAVPEYGMVLYRDKFYSADIFCADNQYETPWKVNEYHQVELTLLGFKAYYNLYTVANPYTSIAISGENELNITFTKRNGETNTCKATWFDAGGGDEGILVGYLYTDDGEIFTYARFSFYSEDGDDSVLKGLTLQIGNLKSNPLDNCKWFYLCTRSRGYGMTLNCVADFIESVFHKQFTGYDGIINDSNIDEIIVISAILRSKFIEHNYENGKLIITADNIQRCIYDVFGKENADVTKSSMYRNDGTLAIPGWGFGEGPSVTGLQYSDGRYIYYHKDESTGITVTAEMDTNGYIGKIKYSGFPATDGKPGDINGDGKINAFDALLLKKLIVGKLDKTLYENAADLNKDGKINVSDALKIRQLIVGKT